MFIKCAISVLVAVGFLAGCSPDDGDNNTTDMGEDSDLFDTSETGWLLHVNGRSASDIYVVGGEPDGGAMLHYDGDEWSNVSLPAVPLLNWVHLFDDQAVVVGNGGTVLIQEQGEWVVEQTPVDRDLWGVWGSSMDDIWAVGGNGREAGQATIIRRQNGEWSEVPTPELERPGVNAWYKVWGSGADNVYIVGQRGGMLRWNGQDFEELGIGTSRDLISIHGVSADAITVVGGRSNGVIGYYDGDTWTSEELSPAPGVNGVWMTSENEARIVGVRGLFRVATLSADGIEVPRTPPITTLDLHAVSVFEGYGLIAVGGNFNLPQGPYEGEAIREAL